MIRVFYQDAGLIREVVKMKEPILELEKYQEKSVRDKELIVSLQQQLADLKEKGKEKPTG